MPYTIRKVRNKNCYQLKNSITGKVFSKCTSIESAKKQLRLLNAVEHGWKPNKSKTKKSKRKSLRKK
jgi:hypothetical protein